MRSLIKTFKDDVGRASSRITAVKLILRMMLVYRFRESRKKLLQGRHGKGLLKDGSHKNCLKGYSYNDTFRFDALPYGH